MDELWLKGIHAKIAALNELRLQRTEITRLRELVKDAYAEGYDRGFDDRWKDEWMLDEMWPRSKTSWLLEE